MRLKKWAAITAMAAAIGAFAAPAAASLTFQGVTFTTIDLGDNKLELDITNALSGGTGNWTNINFLSAFEIKEIGAVTSATLLSAPSLASWDVEVDHGLNASAGCTSGGTPGACFFSVPPIALTDSMSFTMQFFGTNLNFAAPHVKVQFLVNAGDDKANNDLLSLAVISTTQVPEPGVLALLLAGIGLLGAALRRRSV